MRSLLVGRLLPALDRVGAALGGVAMVMIVILIAVMIYEVISRKVFNSPNIWANDITYMFNGTLFLVGAAATLRLNAHIRIDFLSTRLPVRVQHLINLTFYVVIFLPALWLTVENSIIKAHRALVEGELENMSAWEPVIWPFLTGIAIGVTGLFLQVIVESVRHAIGIADPDAVPSPAESNRTV